MGRRLPGIYVSDDDGWSVYSHRKGFCASVVWVMAAVFGIARVVTFLEGGWGMSSA